MPRIVETPPVLSVAQAVEQIVAEVHPLPPERVPLLDALGRVLAHPVVAPLTLPPWDNSAMDGYAVRAADILGAGEHTPITLPVRETIAAGGVPSAPIEPGVAVRIMTGAPVPEGADTVVRVEDTDGGTERVTIVAARDARKNIRARGEDLREGAIALPDGAPIGAAQVGVLASVGAAVVDVHRRPRVALLGSGDELVDLDRFSEALAGRRIVSSNSYTLQALVRLAGGDPVNLGLARDDPADLRERLERVTGCDLLVTTAGVSVGEFDYTREVLAALGAEMKFWKVQMRPGAPLGYGTLRGGSMPGARPRGMPWIGLPGNPVSTMVTFELFVRPVIRRMLGHQRIFRRPTPVTLEEPVTIAARLTHFLRAIVTPQSDGTLTACLTGPQGSGILTSMAKANALLVVPHDRPSSQPGDTLHALLLGDETLLTTRFAL